MSNSEGNFQDPDLHQDAPRQHFKILTPEGMKDREISFDHLYVRVMGRPGYNTNQISDFLGSLLRII